MQLHKESQQKTIDLFSPWDEAIQDAERKLKHTGVKNRRLQAAIECFKANRDAGHPWPGTNGYTVTQKAGTEKDSIPA